MLFSEEKRHYPSCSIISYYLFPSAPYGKILTFVIRTLPSVWCDIISLLDMTTIYSLLDRHFIYPIMYCAYLYLPCGLLPAWYVDKISSDVKWMSECLNSVWYYDILLILLLLFVRETTKRETHWKRETTQSNQFSCFDTEMNDRGPVETSMRPTLLLMTYANINYLWHSMWCVVW